MKKKSNYPSSDKPHNTGHSFFECNPIIPSLSVYNAIKLLSSFYSDKNAIDCLDLTVSYNKLFDDSITISKALKELGVKKGEIIAVSMPNYYQAVASFLACNRIGAVTTFLNPDASSDEICEYLNIFESPIFINFDKSIDENIKLKCNTGVKYIITLSKNNINNIQLNNNYQLTKDDTLIDFNGLEQISKHQKICLPTNSSKDNSLILFTSGSTGKPKSVVLTNENILAAATYLKNSSNSKSIKGDKTLVCVPFMYPYGFSTSTLMTLMSGKTAILAPNMSKETISYYLKKEPNIIFGSPALLELIMKNIPENQDLSSIMSFISGGDFLTRKHYEKGKKFFEKHGAPNVEIGNGSGNAETVSCGTNHTGIEIRPDTVGKILVGTDFMVVDPETMEEKTYGEEGLLCISGKHVFKEYYNEPKITAESKFERNGKVYFKTGTLGFVDTDGYFTLTGRESRFYIVSSLNKVYCDHVQSIISNIEEVDECAVVKVPDEELLFSNKVYVVLKEGYSVDNVINVLFEKFNSPIKHSNGDYEQLKWYEIPKYVEIVESLPRKAGTEKIDYNTLEKMAIKTLDTEKVLSKKYN